MTGHTVRIEFGAVSEPQPRWSIECPEGCQCDSNLWLEQEGGWPMLDLHAPVEFKFTADVWWHDGIQVKPTEDTADG